VDVATLVDFTVVSVLDVESKEMVYQDRFNRVDYRTLEDRLEAVYKLFGMTSMIVESNSIGQEPIEELNRRKLSIIPFVTTSATKQAAIQALQAAFEHGEIKILNDPVLIEELQAFEGERTASGAWKYGAPEGMHEDCVMSLAIAWSGMGQQVWSLDSPL
jgi:phage terminase large subunit-like protein